MIRPSRRAPPSPLRADGDAVGRAAGGRAAHAGDRGLGVRLGAAARRPGPGRRWRPPPPSMRPRSEQRGPPAADQGATAASGVAAAPSTAYEEWLAHEHDRIDFTPGARVTVGLHAAIRRPLDGGWSGADGPARRPGERGRDGGRPGGLGLGRARQRASGHGRGTRRPARASPVAAAPIDAPARLPSVEAPASSWQATAADAGVDPAAAAGLRRQVFGFLPYWEVPGASSSPQLRRPVDDRVLLGRRRRGGQPPQAQQRRLADHGLGGLDELVDDLGDQQRPRPRHAAWC